MKGLRFLYFHLVSPVPKTYFPEQSTLRPETLEKQLRYLSKSYGFVGEEEVLDRVNSGKKFKKEILLTTDDGFKENHTVLLPLLHKYKVQATFFLISECLNNKHLMWRHLLFHLEAAVSQPILEAAMNTLEREENLQARQPKETLMNWSFRVFPMGTKDHLSLRLWQLCHQPPLADFLEDNKLYLEDNDVKELLSYGHSIGSHTATHPDCSRLTEEELIQEVNGSSHWLRGRYKANVRSFSFPFGRPDAEKLTRKVKSMEGIEMIFGIREKLGNNSTDLSSLERTSIEMEYNRFFLNFHFNPLKEKYLRR